MTLIDRAIKVFPQKPGFSWNDMYANLFSQSFPKETRPDAYFPARPIWIAVAVAALLCSLLIAGSAAAQVANGSFETTQSNDGFHFANWTVYGGAATLTNQFGDTPPAGVRQAIVAAMPPESPMSMAWPVKTSQDRYRRRPCDRSRGHNSGFEHGGRHRQHDPGRLSHRADHHRRGERYYHLPVTTLSRPKTQRRRLRGAVQPGLRIYHAWLYGDATGEHDQRFDRRAGLGEPALALH